MNSKSQIGDISLLSSTYYIYIHISIILIANLLHSYPRHFQISLALNHLLSSFLAPKYPSVTVYRSPSSFSPLSEPNSVFLEDFHSFLSLAATTPHEFIITGDFNIYLDNPADHLASQFLCLLSSFKVTQHVIFPTRNKHHIL